MSLHIIEKVVLKVGASDCPLAKNALHTALVHIHDECQNVLTPEEVGELFDLCGTANTKNFWKVIK